MDKRSLRGKTFNKIREDILAGTYARGDAINESKVSKKLGVSRTPVREAIRQLELEELVEIVPNRGAIVTGITEQDLEDIYSIRKRIEGLAAAWCAKCITEGQMEAMEEILILAKHYLDKDDLTKLYDLDTRFHQVMYEGTGSRILKHILTDFHSYAQKLRMEAFRDKERATKSIHEHTLILEALSQGDEKKAEEIATLHIQNAFECSKERLQ